MGVGYGLISNKGVLAYLWELASKGSLTTSERSLIETFIPRTYKVNEATVSFAIAHRSDLVLKPVTGLQGRGVVVGKEVSHAWWKENVQRIAEHEPLNSYVVQEYFAGDEISLVLENHGKIYNELSRIVWGLHVFGEHHLGGYVRSMPVNTSAVINTAQKSAGVGPFSPSDP